MEGVCRVCLAGDRRTYSVADTALEQTYDVVTSDKLQRAGRPTALCCVCVSQLRRCRRFIETARESNDALDRWYRNDTHTDLKLLEQPLFRLTEHRLFHISYDEAQVSGVKQETLEPVSEVARMNEDDGGHFLTEDIKYATTSDPASVSHDKRTAIQTSNVKDYIQFSSIKTENNHVWVPVIDRPKLKKRKPNTTKHRPVKKSTASTPRKQRTIFSCSECSYKTDRIRDLKQHSLKHTGEKPFACDQCNYKCTRKFYLKNHLMNHMGEALFMCDTCDFKCNTKGSLKLHLLTHTDERPFACDKCDYKSRQKGNLKMHIYTHTGEKPFACDQCSFSCNLKKNLKIHLMTHTGEKPFMCDKCDYKCRQSNDLKRHLLTHTGEKPFACDKCDYKCKVKAKLKRHSITHEKNRNKN